MSYYYNIDEGRLIINTKKSLDEIKIQKFYVINGAWEGKIDVDSKTIEIFQYDKINTTSFDSIKVAVKNEHQYY